MKYCRFESAEGPQYGRVEICDGDFWITERMASPWAAKVDADCVSGAGPGSGSGSGSDARNEDVFAAGPLSAFQLLPPVTPSKIVCVGRNYRDHAKELGNEAPAEPLLFFKPPSSLLAAAGVVRMPKVSSRVDFEGELGVIIGKRARRLRRDEDLRPYIHGYTLANDVTARDLQQKDGQWTRAKGFDTFCPVGPMVETELKFTEGLTIETHVNGELRQHGSTLDFIFPLPMLLEYITAAITLEPGDLLLTGTPAGVGPLAAGDLVEVSIPGLGRLSNRVEPEEE
jgi:2-keto-4-pentenoate hydratase/2-oxohepta-3-ene-1,7-dioic acid hydratase in catechol pathway